MNTTTITKHKWFMPWQDEQEEAWLGEMSREGMHLTSVHLLCSYTFEAGEPRPYTYRLDYMLGTTEKLADYFQIFQDAGWEYIGEMSNWRYWRKLTAPGETAEIFTDKGSKIKKYRRLLGVMLFFLFFLVYYGIYLGSRRSWFADEQLLGINAIYLTAILIYAILIPLYVFTVVKLLIRIKKLTQKIL